eukprot:10778527-Alexandrium_andersonii.AAC.1
MQSPAVPTTANGAIAMTQAAMTATPSLLESFVQGHRDRRQEGGALHVPRVLGARAMGAKLHVQAAQLHACPPSATN